LYTFLMPFVDAYRTVSKSIIGITSKFRPGEVVGTGFVISAEGIVCTCRHVVEALLAEAAVHGGDDELGAEVLIQHELEYQGRPTLAFAKLPVYGYGHTTFEGDTAGYLGPNPPDVSYLLLPIRELPFLSLAQDSVQEGENVAFAGYPMGSALLRIPGHFERLTPTLHAGIVSAVLPDRCAQQPFGFWLHANTQGGASGSPVFREDASVVGMVYRVARDEYVFGTHEQGYVSYLVPTSLTGCISRETIEMVLPRTEQAAARVVGRQTFAEVLAEAADITQREPGAGIEGYRY
jgi:hypothetical protein